MQPYKAVPPVQSIAKQGTETRDPLNWGWVETSVWTKRMLAALGNGVKGGKWFSLIDKVYDRVTLEAAWKRVAANKGAAGIDKVSVKRFKACKDLYLTELENDLRKGRYQPEAVRRVYIPKGKGQTRPLGIPTVKDRVVQAALKIVLEPIFEREFLPVNFGFRPGLGCKDALRRVDYLIKQGYTWVLDADLKTYFDSIPHGQLLERVKEKISDGGVISLVESFLNQDIMDGMERWSPTAGSPQGAVLSPLLANLYLNPFDAMMTESGHKVVRYADDFVILCRSKAEAEAILIDVQEWTKANGLTLHPDKTHIGNCLGKDQGFEFLGYRFEAGNRCVRKKSLMALRDKIRQRTRRTRGVSVEQIIGELNPSLKGWFGYFKHARSSTFRGVDGFVRRRLRAVLRKQNKRPGQGTAWSDKLRWPNAFFAERGLFTMHEAHITASQSR
jgi:RNA-directed DNA polymerase